MERTFLNLILFFPKIKPLNFWEHDFLALGILKNPEFVLTVTHASRRLGPQSAGPLVPQLPAPLILPTSQGADGPNHPLPSTSGHRQATPGHKQATPGHARPQTGHARPAALPLHKLQLATPSRNRAWQACGLLGQLTLGLTSLVGHDLKGGDVSLLSTDVPFGFLRGPVWHPAGPLEDAHHSPSSGKDRPAITTRRQEHSGRNAPGVKAASTSSPPHLCPVHRRSPQGGVKATSVFPNNKTPPRDERKARRASTTMQSLHAESVDVSKGKALPFHSSSRCADWKGMWTCEDRCGWNILHKKDT